MPELPEVEVVCRGLNKIIPQESFIKDILFFRENIRGRLPFEKVDRLRGQKIRSISRRAKYILIELDRDYIISHLGMTGSWRQGVKEHIHDHVEIILSQNIHLIYNDPRRFGVFEILSSQELLEDRRWKSLGPEPLSKDLTASYLFESSRGKTTTIKTFLMDQRVVVGVGNIYAVEALFKSGISPLVQARKIKKEQFEILISAIRTVLKKAIQKGGSTISSFTSSEGQSGYFQDEHFVYGRAGEKCKVCRELIKVKVVAGRSTFWCVKCQKR